jgi:pyruvate dehydrogenase E2 component (dihydrolipoamide acetyltransferase)
MAEILRLPKMSDTMEEGVFAEILVKVGDTISSGDVIAEVETDKATMEWEAFQEGTVLHLEVESGDTIPVNGIVAVLGAEGEDFQEALDAAKKEDASEENKTKNENNHSENESSIETSKEDDEDNTVEFEVSENNNNDDERIKASPLAKKIAEEKGIDISNLKGSGDEGRIVKKDVENYNPSKEDKETKKDISEQSQPPIELPKIVAEENYKEVKVSQMRKTTAKRLSESKFNAPHFYLTVEVNMNGAIKARAAMNEVAPSKISFNDLVIKATALAIRKHPAVNASWLGDTIRYNDHIHIGMAVAVDEGLLVPVIKFADNKTLSHISVEATEFADKAKNKKLSPDEMKGNTFSISNLGMMGISEFTAVINPPDSCILAVGGIKKELAMNEEGDLIENNIMKLTLSCDHRTVDGATGAKFLNTLKENLEQPVRMLI